MLKDKLDWLSKKMNLEVYIAVIIFIMVIGSIIIINHTNNRFSNLISFIGSLTGGLITLIAVYLTNRYYNQQKNEQYIEEKMDKTKLKLQVLKFLGKEVVANKTICYSENRYAKAERKFNTVIWEEFRKEFAEIYIHEPVKEFSDLQLLYKLLMEQNNSVTSYKKDTFEEVGLFTDVEESINKLIKSYYTKLENLKKCDLYAGQK